MKCHYEVLQIAKDASVEEIKKARDRLARQYHPDKAYQLSDPSLIADFTATFRLIQQAYEVLSDTHERAWYDSHREQILNGKGSVQQDVEIFSFFNTSCYSGFADDDKGFFTVYRNLFEKISEEDKRLAEDAKEELEVPAFGTSTSSYEEFVNPFYGFWQSYSTKRPFYSLDKWDLRQAENRRVSRAMEKENKKLRDAAKKEWNDSVRELVGFVRKRDPRVKAYRKLLEEKAAENQRKAKEIQEQHLRKRQEFLASTKNHDSADMEKRYRELENSLGGHSTDEGNETEEIVIEDDVEIEDEDPLYCISCDKRFKSFPAMRNHIKSNMHKRNMELLRSELEQDEETGLTDLTDQIDNLSVTEIPEPEIVASESDVKMSSPHASESGSQSVSVETKSLSDHSEASGKRKVTFGKSEVKHLDDLDASESVILAEDPVNTVHVEEYQSRNKAKKDKKAKKAQQKVQELGLRCGVCKDVFDTRNKLFQHIKDKGHAVLK
ncbi:dnaJ homolog subfamily C member 21-like [Paramacrobiotus metropolitanus]|uniref:dnaJ homolog subfamily C member 21-like n=1 Tax=Paramacrobiotus metropolitanus TaxID=2943436 RepID=UPI0024463530|nr:dnaJ homolog subfamily C member 21-like [Paramacrobiotus metropolitanus]